MTILNQVARVSANTEAAARSREFCTLVKCLALSNGEAFAAPTVAKQAGATDRVQNILQKSAVAPHSMSNTSELADYKLLAEGFVGTLRHTSAFEAILGANAFRIIPARTRIGTITSAPTAYALAEEAYKAMTRMSIRDDGVFDLTKAVAFMVLTSELLRSPLAVAIIERELTAALGAEVDALAFADILQSGTPNQASAGTTGANALTDVAWLLSQVSTSARSRLYFVGSPSAVKAFSTRNGAGVLTFPALGPLGGTILGQPALVSDGIASGVLALLDAAQIYAAADSVTLSQSRQATIAFDDAPDAGSTVTSLWQTNQYAVRVERYFAAVPPVHSGAVAYISGVA